MTSAISGRWKVWEFLKKKKRRRKKTKQTNILIIFTPAMVKILHAYCNIIINVPMRKGWSAAGVWQIISFQTGKQSTVGRDWSPKRQFGTRLGFHLSDDGGPNGPPRLGLGLGGFLWLSYSLTVTSQSSRAMEKGITLWAQPPRLLPLLQGTHIPTIRSNYSPPPTASHALSCEACAISLCRNSCALPHTPILCSKPI